MASFDQAAAAEILTALRNANDGWAITVWNSSPDGAAGWKLWRTLDAKYAGSDPGFLMNIPLHEIADALVRDLRKTVNT